MTSSTTPRSTKAVAAKRVWLPSPRPRTVRVSACWSTSCPTTSASPPRRCRCGGGTCCARGPESVHAKAFDIDWAVGDGKIRLPMLGDGDDELAELRIVDGELRYYDHRFPIADGTGERHAAAGARPAALRADELPAGGRGTELPPVLRHHHPGRDPGRTAGGLCRFAPRDRALGAAGLGGRAADRPPGRPGRSRRLPRRPGRR